MAASAEWPALVRAWLRGVREPAMMDRAIAGVRAAGREWEPLSDYLIAIAAVAQEINWPPLQVPAVSTTTDEALTLELLGNHRYAMLCHFSGHKAIEKEALDQGRLAAARSTRLAEEAGDDALAGFYRGVAARAYWMRGELAEARRLLRESIDISKRLMASRDEELAYAAAVDLGNLAEIEKAAGDQRAAHAASMESLAILDSLGSAPLRIVMLRYRVLMDIGTSAFALGDHAASRDAFDRAVQDARSLAALKPHPILERQVVEALSDGASARFQLLDFRGGRERLLEGEALIRGWSEGDEQLMVSAGKLLNSLAYAEKQLGDLEAAKRIAERALAIRRRLFDTNPPAHRANLAMTLSLLGDIERAIDATNTRHVEEAWAVKRGPQRRSPVTLPAWAEHARRFFALRRYDELARAIEVCDDERIGAFLRAIRPLREPDHPRDPFVRALLAEGREGEAALVTCLFAASELEKMALQEFQPIFAARGFQPEPFLALATLCETHDLHDCAAAILFLTGKMLCDLLDEARGHEVLSRARADLETSGRAGSLMTLHASILNSIGAARRGLRDNAGAAAVLREAVELRRTLAGDGDPTETKFLGNALFNLANALLASNDPEAVAYLREALAAYRTVDRDGDTLALQAKCLCLLGIEAGSRRDVAMLRYFAEALQAARTAHRRQADLFADVNAVAAYDPILVSTVLDAAQALLKTPQWMVARGLVDEALTVLAELPPAARHRLARFEAAAEGLHAELLQRSRRDDEAGVAAQQAIAIAEQAEVAAGHRHHVKGPIRKAYQARLRQRAEANDGAGVYSALCSLRRGDFVEPEDGFAATLTAGCAQLAAASMNTGRPIVMLIAERLGEETLLAVLTHAGLERVSITRRFIAASTALWNRLEAIATEDAGSDAMNELEDLGTAAWEALPAEVREALATGGADILISADDYWSGCPWEALLPARGGRWLGLEHVLARWSDLSPAGLASLRAAKLGEGAPVAAVVSPWDAIETHPLPGALAESRAVASALQERGYLLIEDDVIAGARATAGALAEVIAQEPAVLHFCGHGAIERGEEVLVLAGNELFGSAELREYCRRFGAPRALRGNPLVVLNCCDTGRTRSFGGEREDLAGLLLAQGGTAVIAWPVEVDDAIGERVGQLLYERPADPAGNMGDQVVHVRRTIAGEYPDDALWMFLQYHGNPYAALPV